jgi:hypothetical protein
MSKENVTRRISIYVNGKEVENSLKGIDGAIIHTRNALRGLVEGSDNYDARSAELTHTLSQLTERQQAYRQELGLTRQTMDDSAGSFSKFKDGLLSGDFASAKEGLSGIKTEMTNLVKSTLAFVSTPIGATIALLTGFIAGAKAVFEFNQEAEKSAVLIENLSGKTGQVVEDIRIKMQAMTDTFGLAFDQLAGAVDNLVDTGVAKDELEALEKIKNGLLTAPDKNEFVASLESSALTAKQVGLSLEEVIAIKKQIEETGVDPEATFGAMQKASQKLAVQADSLRTALTDAFGAAFSDDILAKVKTGQLTTVQALDLIGKKSKEVGLNQTEQAKISTELFGKAGLAAGGLSVVLDTVTGGLKKQKEQLNGNQKALLELSDANEKLGKAQSELFRIKDFGELWTKIKASATDALSSMLNWIIDVKKDILPLIEFVGIVFVNAWIGLKNSVIIAFDLIGGALKLLSNTISTTFNIIKKILTLDFSGAFDVLVNGFKNVGNIVGDTFAKIKNTILGTLQNIISNIAPFLSALGLDVDKIQKKLESLKSKEIVLKTSAKTESSGTSGEKAVTKETAEELAKQKALRDAARQKEADARKKAADKKRAEEEKAAKEELDKLLALAKAKADLAKAELNYFIANNRSKLDSTKALTPEIIAEEARRLNEIKDRQLLALDEENVAKIQKASADAKSAEELATIIETISIDYETRRIELVAQTDAQILENKNTLAEQDKQLKAEQLQADNELELAEADAKGAGEAARDKQEYDAKVAKYKEMRAANKITEVEFNRFMELAKDDLAKKETQRRLDYTAALLGGLNTIAGALGEMFGQSKELAIVQANISGAQAVLGIWAAPAAMPQPYDAILKGVLTAGVALQTVNQISTIRKQKAPKKPKFFDGGHTGSDAIGYDEYGKIVGDVHEEEYVVPKVMTQNPRYANTLAWLEQERTGKTKKFFDGGGASEGAVPVGVPENVSSLYAQLYSAINALNGILKNGIKAYPVIGYAEAQRIQDLNDERDASTKNGIVGS